MVGLDRDSFLAWTKVQRARDLMAQLPEEARARWDFPRLVALLEALGVTQPRQYLEAGWWIPEAVRRDREKSEALYQRIQQAMARGQIPPRDADYSWDDVRRLLDLCGFTPGQLLEQLAYVYALTLGEQIFLRCVREVVEAGAPGAGPAPGRGTEGAGDVAAGGGAGATAAGAAGLRSTPGEGREGAPGASGPRSPSHGR